MKLRFSLLNLLLLLMFWGPPFLYIVVMATYDASLFDVRLIFSCAKELMHPSTLDDYRIHLLGMLSAPLVIFIILSVIYLFFDWWARLNYWMRFGLMLGLYIIGYILVCYFAFFFMKHNGTQSSCPGGSPILLLGGLFIFYVPIGFVVTLIAGMIKSFRSPPYE